jgi:hypothetical protein
MLKKSFVMFTFFVMVVLSVVLPVQTTYALDAPTIAPTQLDFDASQAPKGCNDKATFRYLLGNLIVKEVLSPQADRQLIVRIRRSPTGGKRADLTLVDAVGTTIDQDHKKFAGNTECYKVLYELARAAAKLLGAFDKPPPPEPCPTCPTCPPPPAPAKPEPCPTSLTPATQPSRFVLPAPLNHRVSFGAGVFLGMTTKPEARPGPYVALSVVPFSRVPDFRLEFDGAWVPRPALQTVPAFVSLCHAHHGLRLCGGLATTFLSIEPLHDAPQTDTLHMTLAGSLRIGTEFVIAGPVSIRADVFTLVRFTERTFGPVLAKLDTLSAFGAGAVAMAVWSLE